jgi:hypothetical protein
MEAVWEAYLSSAPSRDGLHLGTHDCLQCVVAAPLSIRSAGVGLALPHILELAAYAPRVRRRPPL